MSLDISRTIVSKSDQLNADQLLGGPITITVSAVRIAEGDQPVVIQYQNDNGRPYKPCLSMRKILAFAWGTDAIQWVGRSITLYNDPEVMFGGKKVGGIRISHLSHIKGDITASITVTRGKKREMTIKKLQQQQPAQTDISSYVAQLESAAQSGTESLIKAWQDTPKTIRAQIGPSGCPEKLKEIARKADNESSETLAADSPENGGE